METVATDPVQQLVRVTITQPQPQLLSTYEFATILFEEFEKCKAANPRFSIRAFARKININPATLSSVFKGKRKLPRKYALDIVERLKLRDSRRHRFLRSLKIEELPSMDIADMAQDQRNLLDPKAHRHILVEWEYFAVFHLLEIPQAWTAELVATRLNISPERGAEVLQGLEAAGFISQTDGTYRILAHNHFRTTEDIPCETLRLAHENELRLAIEKVHNVPIERRHFTSRTMAIDKAKIPQAKKAVQRFSQELADFLTEEKKDDVYLLSVQLFPFTSEAAQ